MATEEITQTEEIDYRRELTREELELTQAKVEKINARAAKRGWTGRLTVEADRTEITEENDGGIEVTRVVYLTKITGDAPKYDGWTFLAVLDWHSAGGELITRVSPGVELDGVIDRSELREGACDHCHTVRDRKDIYLVRHEDGRTLQVGSTCLKDFMGWTTVPAFISQDEADDMYESMSGPGRWIDFRSDDVLAVAWALIKRDGFRPASFDASTKSDTLTVMDPRTDKERAFAREIRPLVDEGRAQVDLIKAFVLSDAFNGGEYAVNLKVALRAEYVTARLFGLVVSAPQAWARSVERDLTRKAEKNELVNEWLGQAGDKLEVTVTVQSIRCIEGDYGTTWLYTLVTDDKHLVKWFASRSVLGEEVTDKVFTIKGTVKSQDIYNDAKSTRLTRCKLV